MFSMFRSEADRLYQNAGIILVIVGVIFSLAGGLGFFGQMRMKRSMRSAQATITAVYSDKTEVQYFADGQAYTVQLNYCSDLKRPGDIMTIYYQPGHPEEANIGESGIFVIFFIIGMVVLIAGCASVQRYKKINRKRRYLLAHGQKIFAKIIRIESDYRYERTHSYARRLICQYNSPDGDIHIFKSDPVWMDFPDGMIGDEAPINVERGKYDNYFVDVSFMMSGVEIHIHNAK